MAFGSLENSRMKFIRNATSISASETRPSKGAGKNPWSSVQLVNPQESNLALSAGIVEHDSKDTTQLRFRWHEVVLVLDGEMVVQDAGSGGVYKARKGDLFYLGPDLDARIGGKFKAYHVTTPPLLRHMKGSQGEANVVSLLDFGEEIEYPGSQPDEMNKDLLGQAEGLPNKTDQIKIKLIKGATTSATIVVDDILTTQLQDSWLQVDLINPYDANLMLVAGIAEHPTKSMPLQGTYFWFHQLVVILEGEMVIEDLDTGGVYRAHPGDFFYWAPGHSHKNGGAFKAFFVKTPVPLRWITIAEGKKVLDVRRLEGETQYSGSPPETIQKKPLLRV